MREIAEQLSLYGLEETLRRQEPIGGTPLQKARAAERVQVAHDIMSSLPQGPDLAFLHGGFCQTFLPHSKPRNDHAVWVRRSGRFSLMVRPGVMDHRMIEAKGKGGLLRKAEYDDTMHVGVPFGSRARLILIYLQSEGQRGRTVSLGNSLSAFMRSLGLAVTGGERGNISGVREQCKRLALCSFTMQWTDQAEDGTVRSELSNVEIAQGVKLWNIASGKGWENTIELSEAFHEHLKLHSVPLDRRAIAHLSGNSLALDLYAFFAYRLHQLREPLMLSWHRLQEQIGSDYASPWKLGQKVREVLPEVLVAYPHAKIEVVKTGIVMHRSDPPVPSRGLVQGFRLLEGDRK